MSLLNKLVKTTSKKKKRLGRGYGSGKGGHTTVRGMKGQKSRSKVPLLFEGGQTPLARRIPMIRGKSRFKSLDPTAEINFNDINQFDFDIVSLETLKANKIIDPRFKKAKIIKTGKLEKAITVKGLKVSAGAAKVIKDKGGKIIPLKK
ncbi:MAG: 50S ribosomal protein L15 [Patescibacteria group bacterium]|nr:50S ribosomal protein L15 [Patescibacteria group bacterium]